MPGLTDIIAEYIKQSNAKEGVELIDGPTHQFRCLTCGKVHTFKYHAVRCEHEQEKQNETLS